MRARAPAPVAPWASYADLLAGVLGVVLLLMLGALVSQSQLAERYMEAHRELEALRLERAALEAKLAQDLDALIAAGLVDLDDGVVAIRGNLLFETGDARVSGEGMALLERAMPALLAWSEGGVIMISGHTDDVPMGGGRYRSNWELSTARATEVVALLQTRGFPPDRLVAAGFGEHRPAADNASAEGRAQNRRVEIARVALP